MYVDVPLLIHQCASILKFLHMFIKQIISYLHSTQTKPMLSDLEEKVLREKKCKI